MYRMLKDGTMYQDLGCDHFKRHTTDQQEIAGQLGRLKALRNRSTCDPLHANAFLAPGGTAGPFSPGAFGVRRVCWL
jgi:hypothetical protein